MKKDWSCISINIGFSPFVWRWYFSTHCPVFAAQRGLFINAGPIDFYLGLYLEIPSGGWVRSDDDKWPESLEEKE